MAGAAGDPLILIKQQLVTVLGPLMPALSDAPLEQVPVNYAWPGTDRKRTEHVWMNGGTSIVSIPSQKTGRKRRNYATTFEIIVEAQRAGQQLDEVDGSTLLQVEVDEAVAAITLVIDEYLADNPTLGLEPDPPRTADVVQLVNIDRAAGQLDVGVISRNILTVRYGARAL